MWTSWHNYHRSPRAAGSITRAANKRGVRLTTRRVSPIGRWRTAIGSIRTSNVAASKTLPLGTTAKVTNLSNGKSATVKVEDRGPYVDGRVVDLTPKVADELDMKKVGVTPVVVAPIAVPQPDGAIKLGAGAAEADPKEVDKATQETAATAR